MSIPKQNIIVGSIYIILKNIINTGNLVPTHYLAP